MLAILGPLPMLLAFIGQVPPPAGEGGEQRQQRLEYLKQRTADFALFRGPDAKTPLPLKPEPISHYSNPLGPSSDGATFLWLDGGRPVAVLSLSLRSNPRNAVVRECTSLSDAPLDCRYKDATTWSPKTGGLLAQRLKDASPPAEGAAQRLRQMREIARRFSITRFDSRTDEASQLRLQPAPLYRFDAAKHQVLDGGVFSFVLTNDPEVLLLVEAIRDKADSSYWQFSLGRMSSVKHVAKLDDREIWSVANYHRDPAEDKKTGPYSEARIGTFVIDDASR